MKTLIQLAKENCISTNTLSGLADTYEFDLNSLESLIAEVISQRAGEPIAHLRFFARQWLVSPEVGMDGYEGLEVCMVHEKGDDGKDAFPVYLASSQLAIDSLEQKNAELLAYIQERKLKAWASPDAFGKEWMNGFDAALEMIETFIAKEPSIKHLLT